MPRAFIGSRGQQKPNGVSVLFFQILRRRKFYRILSLEIFELLYVGFPKVLPELTADYKRHFVFRRKQIFPIPRMSQVTLHQRKS